MTERKEEFPTSIDLRVLVVAIIAVAAATAVAMLLIPQLSVSAAIRGGSIALVAVVFSRLCTRWYLRSRGARR
jgi:hypothetical protein